MSNALLEQYITFICNINRQPISLATLNVQQKNQLRKFFCDCFTKEANSLTDAHKDVLRSLPFYVRFERYTGKGQPFDNRFVSLQAPNLFIPCDAFDAKVFGPNFLEVIHDGEREMLEFLGILQINKTKFIEDFVFPELATMPAEVRDDVMLSCLRIGEQLQKENPEFERKLADTKFIPTPSGKLMTANQVSKLAK